MFIGFLSEPDEIIPQPATRNLQNKKQKYWPMDHNVRQSVSVVVVWLVMPFFLQMGTEV